MSMLYEKNLDCDTVFCINKLGFGIALVGVLLCACTDPPQPPDSRSALLMVPVRASQSQPYAEFNEQIATALRHGETWPKEAMLVALRFASLGGNREGVFSWQATGELPWRYHFVSINDNLQDDAIRGHRITLDIERQDDDSWRIVNAQLSWRCWRKAGDDSFGVDACP